MSGPGQDGRDALETDGFRGSQVLGEQAEPEFLQHPASMDDAGLSPRLQRQRPSRRRVPVTRRLHLGHPHAVAGRVLRQLLDTVDESVEVDGQPAQLARAGDGHEAGVKQRLQWAAGVGERGDQRHAGGAADGTYIRYSSGIIQW